MDVLKKKWLFPAALCSAVLFLFSFNVLTVNPILSSTQSELRYEKHEKKQKVPLDVRRDGLNSCVTSCSIPGRSSPILTDTDLSILRELFPDNSTASYYDKKYWSWQKGMGEQGGILEQWKFKPILEQGFSDRQLAKQLTRCIDFGGYSQLLVKICGEILVIARRSVLSNSLHC
jgi:hypothetical protein